MAAMRGIAEFLSWEGGCLFISRGSGIVPTHAHYAIQIAFGSTSGVRFRPGDDADWTSYDGVVIASRQPHAMDISDVPCNAVVFVEPETREGRAIAERYPQGGITPLDRALLTDVAPPLFAAWQDERDHGAVVAAAQRVLRVLAGGVPPAAVTDDRILRAMAHIRAHVDAPLTLEAVAAEAFLSPSRFRHLFVEQTGMGLRPYILWRRFLRVWDLLMDGASLSAAAHAAGFADAAHLTRTSRRMFGFPPSTLPLGSTLRPPARAADDERRPR